MTTTLQDLRDYIGHLLGDLQTTLPGSTADEVERRVINHAGRWFYSHHSWNFRLRPPVSLSFINDQSYIDLPPDYGEMIGYQMTEGLNYGITFTTPQQIATLRSTTVTVSQNYYWATFVQPAQSDKGTAPGPPRIELWPTPPNLTDALTLWYRAKWQELVDNDDVADVPDFAEFPLALTVRGFAGGITEEYVRERDTPSELNKLINSPVFVAAREADGLLQSDYGTMTGGAIQTMYPAFTWRSASASPVADPA